MKAVHRHSLGHEHEFEPQHGLPEALPADEKILWQGAPDWRLVAVEIFHARKLAIYFALMLTLRAGFVLAEGGGMAEVLSGWAWLAPLAVVAVGIMVALARLSAQTTAYTVTDRRVVLRIGIVLTVTFNIPYRRIEAAGVMRRGKDGHGDLVLTLSPGDRIPILQLWPHARPWQVTRPQPALRGLRNAAEVGRVLTQAWSAARGVPVPVRMPAVASAHDEQASKGSAHGNAHVAGHAA
jgi:hypothetical protein